MNRWQEKWFTNLNGYSKLLFIHIQENIAENGFYDLSMKKLTIALKPATDDEIRAAFLQVKPFLNITADNKKVSIKGCNCEVEPIFKNEVDLFSRFITQFNQVKGSEYKQITKVKTQFTARIKDGYKLEQVIQALKNAMQDDFHIEKGFNDLTPEFITRAVKFEKYLNYTPVKKKKELTTLTF